MPYLPKTLAAAHSYLPPLLGPIHPYFPFAPVDVFGAMRLSSVVDWMAGGAFDAPAAVVVANGADEKSGSKRVKKVETRARASVLQECFGILVVVFGGETFLGMCSGTTPSWLVSPKIPLLFTLIHIFQTRTPFRRFLPAKPSLSIELPLAFPDAIGRALLLTRFTVSPLLNSPSPSIPVTPTSLILVPFIVAVPFASLIFSTTNFLSATPRLDTPAELKPWGWMAVDTWLPVVVPVLFLSLLGPVQHGWPYGLGWSEDEAVVACIAFTIVAFVGRAVYNFGYKREQWAQMFGARAKKIKTA